MGLEIGADVGVLAVKGLRHAVHWRFRFKNVWMRRWVLLSLGLDGHGRDEVRASWKREVRI